MLLGLEFYKNVIKMEEKIQDSCILTNKFLYLHKNRCRTLKQIECIVNVK